MQATVKVLAQGQAWVVRIQDADGEHVVEFAHEQSARSYAEGQRIRLGLTAIHVMHASAETASAAS